MSTMLLVVDLQRGFVSRETQKVVNIIDKSIKLLRYDVCVFSKFHNNDNTSFVRILNWEKLQSFEEQRIVLNIRKSDIIVSKDTYSALTDELKSIIKNGSYDKAYLCGIDTDSCVLATAFELFDYGVKPMIIIDGCASTGGEIYHAAAERIMKRAFGEKNVNTLSYYLEELL